MKDYKVFYLDNYDKLRHLHVWGKDEREGISKALSTVYDAYALGDIFDHISNEDLENDRTYLSRVKEIVNTRKYKTKLIAVVDDESRNLVFGDYNPENE